MKLTQKFYTDDRVKKTMIQTCQKEMRKHVKFCILQLSYLSFVTHLCVQNMHVPIQKQTSPGISHYAYLIIKGQLKSHVTS